MANNILLNFLFSGSSSGLVSAAQQAGGSLAQVTAKVGGLNIASLASVAGIATLAIGLKSLVGTAIDLSAEFQRLSTSFTSILAAPLLDANKGQALTKENLQVLRNESVRLFQDSQLAAIDTVATTKEYVNVLQTALAVGQNVGLSQQQIEVITKRMVLAAGAFGIEFEKVGTGIAQILTGSVRVTNQLGRNLGLTTEEARKQLKVAIEQGKLYEFLDTKTKQFAVTQKEVSNNFLNVKAAITDIFQLGSTAAIAPLFNFLGQQIIQFRDKFIGGEQFFKPALQNLIRGFQEFFNNIIPSIRVLFNEIGNLFNALGSRSSIASSVFKILITGLTELIRLLRQAIELSGPGGLLLGFYLLQSVVPRLIALWRVFSTAIAAQALATRAATSANLQLVATYQAEAVAAREAAVARLGWIGLIVTAGLVIASLVSQTDDASKAIENLDKQINAFSESQHKFGEERNLRSVIDDYRELASQTKRNAEESQRLGQDLVVLKRYFNDNEIAALAAGTAVDGVFKRGQGAASDEIKQRVVELQKLKDALEVVAKGDTTFLDDVARTFAESGSFADIAVKKQHEDFVAAGVVVDQLAKKYIENYVPAQKESADAANRLNNETASQLDYLKKVLQARDLDVSSSNQLLDAMFELGKERDKAAASGTNLDDVNRRIGETEGALLQRLLDEAGGHREIAKANAEKAIASTEAAIKQIENSRQVVQALADEKAAIDDTIGSLIDKTVVSALNDVKNQADEDRLAKLKLDLAEYQHAFALFSIKTKTSDKKGKARSGSDVDELKDFLSNVQKQLELLKKASDEIEKIATRVVDSNRKLIRELADTGVIAFSDSIDLERDLLDKQYKLSQDLAENQAKLIQTAEELGPGVADATANRKAARAAAPRKAIIKGFDSRDRRSELIKLVTDEVEIYNRLGESTRKFEEDQSQLVDREVKHRVAVRKQELSNLDETAKQTEETANVLDSALNKVGLLSNSQLLKAQIGRSEADLDRQRKDLLRQLFPLSDPVFQQLLRDALADVDAKVQGPIGDAAGRLTAQLDATRGDPTKLEAFRQNVIESVKSEGLLNLIFEQRNAILGRVAESQQKLTDARKAAQAFDQEIATTHKAPSAETTAELAKRNKAVADAQAELIKSLAKNQPEINYLTKLIDVLEAVNIPEEKRLEILQALKNVDQQTTRSRAENLEKERQDLLSQLDLQGKIVDFDLQRLDLQDQILNKRAALGIITDQEFKKQELNLIQQREVLLLARQQVLQRQLGTVSANIANNPGGFPALAQQQLSIQNELNGVGTALFDLKQKAFELTSPLLATADAFKAIADSVGNLPAPFSSLKGIFTGLESLAKTLADKSRPDPEQKTLTASQTFEKAGLQFQSAVLQFAAIIQGVKTGITPGAGVGSIAGLPVAIDGTDIANSGEVKSATNEVKITGKALAAGIIRGAGAAVAGVLSGIANKDVGQAIAGFGQLAALIPVAGPFIQAGLEIVGSVVSFFSAAAKKKTQEMAQTITDGISDLKHAIATGAVNLGDGIRQIQARLEDARRQLSGRKGGADALKQIEKDTAAEIQQLRDQAKKIQDDFKANLDLLRSPKGLRDTITAIEAISAKAREFIKSFENPADALAAVKDAQEFVRLSIQELKDDIQKTLADLQTNLKDAVGKFAVDQRNILLEGRINPVVSVAESKRQRLVELEQQFRKEQKNLEDQIAGENLKLDYANSRAKIEDKIARLAQQGADALGRAADKLNGAADNLSKVFNQIGQFPYGATGGGSQATASTLVIDLKVDGESVGMQTIGIDSARHYEMAGLISPSRRSQFNPVLPK